MDFLYVPYFGSDPLLKSDPAFARIVEKAQTRPDACKRKLEANR
jgi:hypothetical protein